MEPRRLIRSATQASLGTLAEGWPSVTLVLTACEADGTPILLLSDLALHSRNIAADPRVSLLFAPAGGAGNFTSIGGAGNFTGIGGAGDFTGIGSAGDPLDRPRLTVMGRAERIAGAGPARRRFLARHPGAALYADFADFHFYRVAVTRAHSVAGFARIRGLEAGELLLDAGRTEALIDAEPALIARVKADLGREATGIDPEGVDWPDGRSDFAAPVFDPDAAWEAIRAVAPPERRHYCDGSL